MVFIVPLEKYHEYRELFNKDNCPETFVESAFKYKKVPLVLDREVDPTIAILDYGFTVFIVGDPDSGSVKEMLDTIPEKKGIFAKGEKWKLRLKEHFKDKLLEIQRTKLSHKEITVEKITELRKPLPEGFTLEKISEETAKSLPPILGGFIPMLFGNIDNFMKTGVGFCLKNKDEPISIAASFFPYTTKLEIQVITVDSPEYRRKGYGTAVCIALIDYCLQNGIEPYWDAANEPSVHMALKLGYIDPEPYTIYAYIDNK